MMKIFDHKRVCALTLPVLIGVAVTCLVLFLLPAPPAVAVGLTQADSVPCLNTSDTLEELVSCIYNYMPRSYDTDGRDGFDVPTATEMDQWREVVGRMMAGECATIDLNGYGWGSKFTVTAFIDTQTSIPYCVFMETRYDTYSSTQRVTHGWGTFIHNPAYQRELNISASHAISDMRTATQTISVFKQTQSRTFLMAGAHRNANNVTSACQSSYKQSDAAHNTAHMFDATVAELLEYCDSHNCQFHHLQFHGMGSSSCSGVDVHMTHGLSTPPDTGAKILELKSNLVTYNPTWTVTVPGDSPSCDLHGSTNVQGRRLNNVAAGDVCTTAATNYSGQFIHIEQKSCCRDANNWINAISDTFSAVPKVEFSSVLYSVDEGDGPATITVNLEAASGLTATVGYATSDGTATAGNDYTAVSGTLTFTPGIISQTFTVPITDDALNDAQETVTLALNNPCGLAISGVTATLTITDNDFIYLPIIVKSPIDITGVVCRVSDSDKNGFKIWLPQKIINAYFSHLGLTPPFTAKVRPVHPQTGALMGQWVSLPVDSYDHSIGMRDWVICDLTMKENVRQALCWGDPACDLDEIAKRSIEEKVINRSLDRTLRFEIESK